ncbi:thiamine biosynthesis/tRNA modification protein ThiI [gamma proteobacterium HTCC5015]|nr:thiamine biosynthesis/tRNA modification protein ThiI [gamma proteobacterium HTCC5015]
MRFIIKLFPEITIKSRKVRQSLVAQLRTNLAKLAYRLDESCVISGSWDYLQLDAEDRVGLEEQVVHLLKSTPGIDNFIRVQTYEFEGLHDIYEKTAAIWGERLAGKTFAVRAKRVGQHEFSSTEIGRYVGGGLHQNFETGGVSLKAPDITIHIEVRDQNLRVVERRYEGIGGFPLGSQAAAMSLMSGGFDSAVASYLTMSRGLKTHFLFFNLGGSDHEVGVKEVAYYLWQRYGSSHKVKFISVDFEPVVAEILDKVKNSQMGVVLKRMFLRAASDIAKVHKVEALVTGEAIAQVSSQTLPNLAVIDEVTEHLVLRPLITTHKKDIIRIARQIGTEEFSAHMPEYCGVISQKPTTHARRHKIEAEESQFDFSVLDKAVENARVVSIEKLGDPRRETTAVEEYTEVPEGAVVVDIRHPDEEELAPLEIGARVECVPFYKLQRTAEQWPKGQYLLYCDQGVMSRLHARHLSEQRLIARIGVYRP